MNFSQKRHVQRFSIRKLAIGVVSASIGMATVTTMTSHTTYATEQTTTATAKPETATITYTYVPYESLSE